MLELRRPDQVEVFLIHLARQAERVPDFVPELRGDARQRSDERILGKIRFDLRDQICATRAGRGRPAVDRERRRPAPTHGIAREGAGAGQRRKPGGAAAGRRRARQRWP